MQTFIPDTNCYNPEFDNGEVSTKEFTSADFEEIAVSIFGDILEEAYIRTTFKDVHNEKQREFDNRVEAVTDAVVDEVMKVMFVDRVMAHMRDNCTTLEETLTALGKTMDEYEDAKVIYDKRTSQFCEYRRKQ